MNTDVRFDCKFPQAKAIWWSSINPHRRDRNPLVIRAQSNHINKRYMCNVKDMNGKLYRKEIRIQQYSSEELTALMLDKEVERSSSTNQRKSTEIKMLTKKQSYSSIFFL